MTRRQSVSRLTFQSCDPSWGRGRATGNITDHLSSLDPSSLSLPVPLLSSTVQPPAKPQDTRLEGFAWKTLAFSSSLPMANPFRQQLCMPSPQAGRWWGRKNPPNSSHDARPVRRNLPRCRFPRESKAKSKYLFFWRVRLSAEKGPLCKQIPRRFWKLVQNWRQVRA